MPAALQSTSAVSALAFQSPLIYARRRATEQDAIMFAGHYAAAIAAKGAEPKAPFWALVAGCQLVDIAWAGLVMAGIERGRVDPSLPGSTLVLEHMPWTHSLPAALLWSLAAMALSKPVLRVSWRTASVIGAVVFSHWLLDLLVHRPDLELFPGGMKVGFGLWNYPVPEEAVEIGLIAIAGVFWTAARVRSNQSAWPAAAFIALLVTVQIIAALLPAEASDNLVANGPMALATYLIIAAVAIFLDGRRSSRPEPAL
jgi:membrane-bound metal-dependent hydrolase YbcI (DUF457 family)